MSDNNPDTEYYEWTDRNKTVHKVPVGIDPGWDYNVGQASGQSFKVLSDKFETLPNPIARKWMDEYLQGPVFKHFYETAAVDVFPVAVLKESDMVSLGTEAQTVWFSKESLETHKVSHPEITIDDYRLIPEILDTGEVYKSGDTRLIYLSFDGRLYRATLKKTKDGSENYFLSLFLTTEEKAEKEVKKKYERVR